MYKFNGLFILLIMLCSDSLKAQSIEFGSTKSTTVWQADNGDGTYKNPILHQDYSDPDVISVGDDFYMVASSFTCTPGLPILHSKDLVNWKLVNYALKKQVPLDVFNRPQHGKGVWAPSMRFHQNQFYIYYPDPDYGIYMIKANKISGEWSKPRLILAGKGLIDPCPLWDTDGKAYLALAWAGSRAGVNSLLSIFKMNNAGDSILDDGRHVYDGHDNNHTVEGPKLYKRNGYYYIFAPAGGVATGWQLALRSKNIYGPYEEKIVLKQGSTAINGPHQGAWVTTTAGQDWFLHFQDLNMYGRVVHLQPMTWKSDWPVIGVDRDLDGTGEPVLTYKKPLVAASSWTATLPESDEFNAAAPGLQWQWQANEQIQWSAMIPGTNYLRLMAVPQEKDAVNLWTSPNLFLQKFPAPDFTATAKMKYHVEWDVWKNKQAGLLVMGLDYSHLSINKNDSGYYLALVTCKDAMGGKKEQLIAKQYLTSGEVFLRVNVSAPDAACRFSYSEDGIHFSMIGEAFQAKPGRWIGAKVGLFCNSGYGERVGGYVDVDWFRISK